MRSPLRCIAASLILSVLLLAPVKVVFAEQVNIAVASNALSALKAIAKDFSRQSHHQVKISSGSTGKLYAQILHGAPYDIFLAANEREPKKLEQADKIVKGSRFTYALGKLVAYGDKLDNLNAKNIRVVLQDANVSRIAIANPKIAPYGFAARQALQHMKMWDSVKGKIVQGENVSQTFQFLATKNAQFGFFAMSQMMTPKAKAMLKGAYWEVPASYYTEIKQQAVLLAGASNNKAAVAFIQYLKDAPARAILTKQFGYGVVDSTLVAHGGK